MLFLSFPLFPATFNRANLSASRLHGNKYVCYNFAHRWKDLYGRLCLSHEGGSATPRSFST